MYDPIFKENLKALLKSHLQISIYVREESFGENLNTRTLELQIDFDGEELCKLESQFSIKEQ